MAHLVYMLCALTSIGCMVLLMRAYLKKRVRLLLWSGLCFACLAANNILLFVDLAVVPTVDLAIARNLSALAGICLLLYGLIWDTRE